MQMSERMQECHWQKANANDKKHVCNCMDEWINEWMNEQMHRWHWQKANANDKKHECKWVNKCMNANHKKQMPMTKSMYATKWMNEQINEWMNEQMHRWHWRKANANDKKHDCKWVTCMNANDKKANANDKSMYATKWMNEQMNDWMKVNEQMHECQWQKAWMQLNTWRLKTNSWIKLKINA